jgi:Leucine-rich repeat (LRR) protein
VSRGDIAADINNLNRRLQVILKEKHRLQLRSSLVGDHHSVPVRTARRLRKPERTGDIVGSRIEDDAAGLVRQLTETDGRTGCTIVAIIGPDGIGKTTLAKKVYAGERIRRAFGARSWVRVPSEYSEAALLSQVIDSFGGDTTGGESFADLERTLVRLVEKKRFLLVLDDVRYGGVWEDVLRRPLERAAGRGSKVVITARHGSIAREMGAGHVHRVKKLDVDDGWLLLRTAASIADEATAGELKAVGEGIADKCGGVPLAIKAVAGVLRTRDATAQEWGEVLASPAWLVKGLAEEAMKPLYLCYDDLPCHLKQCFLYCSLFPSDLAVDRRVLVQLWIAEGFVQIRADASVEEVAEEYYDELITRHLLQPGDEDEHGGAAWCTTHDMLRALAQLLSHGEELNGDSYRLLVDSDAPFAPRRVSLSRRNLAAVPEKILKLERVRTLLLQKNPLTTEGSIFSRLQHLKVLDLSETAVELIPENLGNLVYLRFLNLSHTRIQAIPESVGNLWSLKFLLLRGCKTLHVLPKGIEHLRGLRDLDLAGTVINDAAFRVGHLRSITSLCCFTVTSKEACAAQDRSGWPLDELKNLSQLRTLHIQKLEKAANRSEATEMLLDAKKDLRELELSCSSTVRPLQTPELVRKIEDIFEEMNPPLCLESLKLVNYFGTRFPRWLSVTFLPNLRDLDIVGCNFCQSFPPLSRLLELRSLYIADSLALKDIGAEFTGTEHQHQVPFPKLENLHFQGLKKLKTWTDIEPGAFPSLQELQLESCPKLHNLPIGLRHVTSLTKLHIADMASLEAVDDIATLRELSVWNTPNLKRISNLPSLEDINMCHCPVLESVENVDGLQTVHIFDHDLRDMPKWIEAHASKLRSLNFTSTVRLLKRCLVDGPDWPVIKNIKEVHGYSTGSSYIYYNRSPYIFESNVSDEDNLSVRENEADPDNADDISVSSSGSSYLEIRGFFDSKVLKVGTTRAEEIVSGRKSEDSLGRTMLGLTHRRLHKLAEIAPEDDEVEDGADSAVPLPSNPTRATASAAKVGCVVTDNHNDPGSLSKATSHESQSMTNDEICDDNIVTSAFPRQTESKTAKDVSSEPSTDGYATLTESAAPSGHNLVRQGSQAINNTEISQDFNFTSIRRKEHTSKKGEGTTADVTVTKDVSLVHPRQAVASNKGKDDFADNAAVSIYSSDIVSQKHIKGQTATSANGSTNATPMPENPSDKEGPEKSAGVTGSSFIHEASHTVFINETTRDLASSLIHSKQQMSDKEGEVSDALGPANAVDSNGKLTEDGNISSSVKLNHEESKALGASTTNCDSGPSKLLAGLACSNQQTIKTLQAASADQNGGTDASSKKKSLGMESKITETASSKSGKYSSGETAKNISLSLPKIAEPVSQHIDITAATMRKAEATTVRKDSMNEAVNDDRTHKDAPCSMDAKADDSQRVAKVDTAVWADTDTDTLRARLVDSMRHLRRMASRRRHRQRKRGSNNKWSIGPALVAILLLVSVVQLLFILWLYRRLLNQNYTKCMLLISWSP